MEQKRPREMTEEEHLAILESLYPEVHPKIWINYPQSIFYYTKLFPEGGDKEVGIWTSKTAWSITYKDTIKTAWRYDVI